jgi:hypothetical protein
MSKVRSTDVVEQDVASQPRICVIGAGPCGLAMAKNLLQVGLRNFVVFDRQRQIGGNWVESDASGHSSVYEGVRSISSRRLTAFADLPFPAGTPDYPTRHQLLRYLQAYAATFGLVPYFQLNTEIARVRRIEGGSWQVTLATGQERGFDHVIVCNGHHSRPNMPELPGRFTGQLLHSHDFKTSVPFAGKRALVIGGGNSGADIAVDLARRCGHTTMSLRRGYHIIPRHLFGIPSDVALLWLHWMPGRPLRAGAAALIRALQGSAGRTGMPKPDHELFATHPLINSELSAALAKGSITIRGPVESVEGSLVRFRDDSTTVVDVIVACTGYDPGFSFLDLDPAELPPTCPLYLQIIQPRLRGIFFLGFFQPSGSIWPLADLQAKLLANHLSGRVDFPHDPREMDRQIARDKVVRGFRYIDSPRHRIEVDFYKYRRTLLRTIPRNAPAWSRPLTSKPA